MKNLRKVWIILTVIILILALTNPTNADFKNYIPLNSNGESTGGRVNYFGIFSVFKEHITYFSGSEERMYVGVFKNFIRIK